MLSAAKAMDKSMPRRRRAISSDAAFKSWLIIITSHECMKKRRDAARFQHIAISLRSFRARHARASLRLFIAALAINTIYLFLDGRRLLQKPLPAAALMGLP